MPIIKNRMKKTRKARMPSPPLVATRVGNNPKPEVKGKSQNSSPLNVSVFIETGLYIAQASLNLFGPTPNKGCFESTSLVISMVASKLGLSSVFDILRRSGITLPKKLDDIKKNKDIITTIKEMKGKFLFSFSSTSWFLWKVIGTL